MLNPEEEVRKATLLQEIKKLEEEIKELEDGAWSRYLDEADKHRYSFAEVKDPESLAETQRFRQIFGRHIPYLLESEHYTINLHGKLENRIFGNPIETINKSTFEADLKRFKGAITLST